MGNLGRRVTVVVAGVATIVMACSSGSTGTGGLPGGATCTQNIECASGTCAGATTSGSTTSTGGTSQGASPDDTSDLHVLGTCTAPATSTSSSSSSTSSGGAGCDGKPEGAYKCSGSTLIQVCKSGAWASAGSCGCSVKVGDPRKPAYGATCKIIIGKTNAVQCDYAGVDCKQCLPGEACKTTCTKCASDTSSSCCP